MNLSHEILDLIHSGKYEDAEAQINALLESSFDNKTEYATALFLLSWLQRGRGLQLTDVAQATTAQLASLALELQNPYVLALALFRRGDISFCKGRLTQAKEDWENAEKLLIEVRHVDTYELVWLKYHLALAIRDLHGYEFAIPKFQEILSLDSCSHSLRYKIIRELFFCYCYLSEYKAAYDCFEKLQDTFSHAGLEIDFQIFKGHLAILKRNFRTGRKLLLEAVILARQSGFGRDRYDLNFHLAYLYARKNDFKRMFRFSKNSDPIYKLQLFNIALKNDEFSVLAEFEAIAFDLGVTQYIEKAHQHRKSRSGVGSLTVDANSLIVTFKNKKLLEYGKKEVRFLILLGTSNAVSKAHIAREIFGDNFYEPSYHDPKIYKLVSAVNTIAPFAVNQEGNYTLNPSTRISILNGDNEKIRNAANKIAAALK